MSLDEMLNTGWIKYSPTCPCGHFYQAVTCIKSSPFACPVIENFLNLF